MSDKNRPAYKMSFLEKIKTALAPIKNRLLLRSRFKSNLSPELIFLHQYKNGTLNRYDIIVRYLMIDKIEGNNTCGEELYMKMQRHRAGGNKKMEAQFLAKKDTFLSLIKNIATKGYDNDSVICLNIEDQLCDGSHRLAAALYYGVPVINIKRSGEKRSNYGWDQFNNFSQEDLELLRTTEQKILEKINIREVLTETLHSQSQNFGRGTFYQSFDRIGIEGQRPTQKRFETYGLKHYLTPETTVLDIGCNCGFFALHIADSVKSIDGIEFNKSLVNIANISKLLLKNHNATFTQGDFNKVQINKKYDLILSFAVHYWIGQEINVYAKNMWNLLNEQGLILFESQDITKQDLDWDDKIREFINIGFEEIKSGELCDDGAIKRRFSLFKKVKG